MAEPKALRATVRMAEVTPDGQWVIYTPNTADHLYWKCRVCGERHADSRKGFGLRCDLARREMVALTTGAADSPLTIAIFSFGGGPPVKILDIPAVS